MNSINKANIIISTLVIIMVLLISVKTGPLFEVFTYLKNFVLNYILIWKMLIII